MEMQGARATTEHAVGCSAAGEGGTKAIRLNPRREAQVILAGGQLVERADMRLPELHHTVYAAMVPTKFSEKDIKAAVGAGTRRGKAKATVGAGRSSLGTCAMTATQRQRLHRARQALREVVRELRLAVSSSADVSEELEAGPPCNRVLSAAERQRIHRARRAHRALK